MRIVGYKDMIAHLKREYGLDLSVSTLRRYADPDYAKKRGVDVLPVEHGIGSQHMVLLRSFDAWVKRCIRKK